MSVTRAAAAMLFWQLARAAIQAAWAIGLARLLGAAGYGLFGGLAGLATSLGALSGMGFGMLLLQRASLDLSEFPVYWPKAMRMLSISTLLLTGGYFLIIKALFGSPLPMTALLAICIPEVVWAPFTTMASYAFQVHDRMGWAGAMYSALPVGNLIALVVSWNLAGEVMDIRTYLVWHLACTSVLAASALCCVAYFLRPKWRSAKVQLSEVREAGGFVAMRIVDTSLTTVDKTLVLRLSGPEVAGHYSAAYRLAALVALPLVSLAISSAPRLFRAANGGAAAKGELRKIAGIGAALAMLTVPVAWLVAGLLPVLMGAEFRSAEALLKHACILPALLGAAILGSTMLVTAGRKWMRIAIQSFSVALLCATMAAWGGRGDGGGAIFALVVTYSAFCCILGFVIRRSIWR